MMKIYDDYGREMFISKEQWRENVLLSNLETHRTNAEQLYNMLLPALEEGFAADVVNYAEHLKNIDTIPSRGATILAIAYMKLDRLEDAQRVLESCIRQHGEEGVVLTNLAKVYSQRGDNDRAETILWHALELDPNQDNGLGWYAVMHRERGGEAAELDAYGRVANLPGSWRARLWLARDLLQRKDLDAATKLYQEAMDIAGEPAPADLLMQMSGDLGRNGHVSEIVTLVGPSFDPEYHGLLVGNNLIKAYLEMGRTEEAEAILKQLYAQDRPDWKQTLNYWDAEIAKAETARKALEQPGKPVSIAMLNIEGPLWMRDGSPFAALIQPKSEKATRIAVFGSTALLEQGPDEPALQLTDAAGRLSRSVPLMVTELLHLTTDAVGIALIPWAQGRGFALFGHEHEDERVCEMVGTGEDAPDYIVGVTVNAALPVWQLNLRLLRRVTGMRVAEATVEANLQDLGSLIENLSKFLDTMLSLHTGVRLVDPPVWYQLPAGYGGADYLLRLEQQLNVTCKNLDFLEGGAIFGEREMLDGALQLCANQPKNPTVRMVFAQTLRMMRKARPDILPEYKEKAKRLERDYPISDEIGDLVEKAYQEAFGA